jgi:hypothetical protein
VHPTSDRSYSKQLREPCSQLFIAKIIFLLKPEGVLVLSLYLVGPDIEGPQAGARAAGARGGAPAYGGGVERGAEQGALVVAVPHVDRQGGRRRQGSIRCPILRLYCHVVQRVLGQRRSFNLDQ